MLVDLHTHTNSSDGQLSATDLLNHAAEAGLDMLAITDHDTTDGLASLDIGQVSGCKLISGIEFSTTWRKIGIHVLGLNIDTSNPVLSAGIERQQAARMQRAETISARLEKLGFPDSLSGAAAIAGNAGISRVHFARHLVDTGQVKSMKDAFRKYLGSGKPGDVRDGWASLEETIDWIHQAGGSAVLAHPAKYKLSNLKMEELVKEFRAATGDALEVVSGRQDDTLTTELGKLANRNELMASCGSDFHQPNQAWARLGEVAPLPVICIPVWESWPSPDTQISAPQQSASRT